MEDKIKSLERQTLQLKTEVNALKIEIVKLKRYAEKQQRESKPSIRGSWIFLNISSIYAIIGYMGVLIMENKGLSALQLIICLLGIGYAVLIATILKLTK